jgi:hypothetical protein
MNCSVELGTCAILKGVHDSGLHSHVGNEYHNNNVCLDLNLDSPLSYHLLTSSYSTLGLTAEPCT